MSVGYGYGWDKKNRYVVEGVSVFYYQFLFFFPFSDAVCYSHAGEE